MITEQIAAKANRLKAENLTDSDALTSVKGLTTAYWDLWSDWRAPQSYPSLFASRAQPLS